MDDLYFDAIWEFMGDGCSLEDAKVNAAAAVRGLKDFAEGRMVPHEEVFAKLDAEFRAKG